MALRNSGDELSLRHLPDASDTSFSFQIPGSVPEENLLADDDLDFFRGADVSAVPSIAPPTNFNQPLTLTPRPAVQKQAPQINPLSFPTLSYQSSDDRIPDLKQEKSTSRVQRPKLSKINTESISKPRPKLMAPSIPHPSPTEGSPTGARLEALRAQVDSLAEDLDARPSNLDQELTATSSYRPKGIMRTSLEKNQPHSRPEKREKPTRTRQKIIEGGITKTKTISKPTEKKSFVNGTIPISNVFSPPRPSNTYKDLHGDQESIADTTLSSLGAEGGVAARLVQYSQKLISSFGHPNFDTAADVNGHPMQANFYQDPEAGTDTNFAQQEIANDTDRLLTASQLSPRKMAFRPSTPTPPANVPISHLRASSKRPVSVASETHQCKKSKTDASIASATASRGSEMSTDSKTRHASTRERAKLNVSNSATAARPTERGIGKTKARGNPITRQAPVFKLGSKDVNDDAQHTSKSSNPSSSTSQLRISRQHVDGAIEQSLSLRGKNKASSFSLSGISSSKPVVHASRHATRPIEFKLHTDSRFEARKDEHLKESANSQSQSRSQREKKFIPDFKALHAAQEAESALRKENVHPTVPLPIRLETDQRVKERQQFDEMLREKGRKQERLMEERRREREEQEEKELRELRKKTVPKAHEVPEWYKEAPKKKDKAIGGIGR